MRSLVMLPSVVGGLAAMVAASDAWRDHATMSPRRALTPGAASYTLTCPSNQQLVGLQGGAGLWVDWFRGVCRHVTADGHWIGGESLSDASTGGASGTPFRLICPQDHAVSGLSGNAGQWINQLLVHCRRLGNSGSVTGPAVLATPNSGAGKVGGSGSSNFGPLSCAGTIPVFQLRGTSGSTGLAGVVDSVRVTCGQTPGFQVQSLQLQPAVVFAQSSSQARAVFTYVSPQALTLRFASNDPAVARVASATVTIARGSGNGTVAVSGVGPGCATIAVENEHGSTSPVSQSLIVHPHSDRGAAVALGLPNTYRLTTNAQHSIPVRMTTARPVTVTLTSSNPQVAIVTPSVTIPPGTPGVATIILTSGRAGCITLSATANGATTRRTVAFGL